jgi:hypothetical protein
VLFRSVAIWATLAQAHHLRARSRVLSALASIAFTGAMALMVIRP